MTLREPRRHTDWEIMVGAWGDLLAGKQACLSEIMRDSPRKFYEILFCLALVLVLGVIYGQTFWFDFLRFDDGVYVAENLRVLKGLTGDGFKWAMTATHASNWHPVTWLSHMLDVELFGTRAGYHHLVSLFWHALNAVLLFILLRKMTGCFWRSGFVAALFALHPLHVESVAWISERKDVLSTFFAITAIGCYLWYVENRSPVRYIWVAIAYALGLMSKPMLVTLPFVLLLLDFWPLGRFAGQKSLGQANREKASLWTLIWEKMPLMGLALASSVVTLYAQNAGGAVSSLESVPMATRIFNALFSYAGYLFKMVWPLKLAAIYPYPETFHWWKVSCSAVLLAGVTYVAIRMRKRWPFVVVGWLWYVGTLIPVIGLVQVGSQAMADRYTYVPLIGIFIMVAWGASHMVSALALRGTWAALLGGGSLLILSVLSYAQTGHWRDSLALFQHAVSVTDRNLTAYLNLGVALTDSGHYTEALKQYEQVLRIKPGDEKASYNMGVALAAQGDYLQAAEYFEASLMANPRNSEALNNLGNCYRYMRKSAPAIAHYRQALRIDPKNASVRKNLESLLFEMDLRTKEITRIEATLRQGEAGPRLYHRLGSLYRQDGRDQEAADALMRSLQLDPEYVPAITDLSLLQVDKGAFEAAKTLLERGVALEPGNPAPYYNLACLYARQNRPRESVEWLKKAVEKGFDDWHFLKNDPDLSNIRTTPYFRKLSARAGT